MNCLEERIGDLICAVRGVHLAPGSDGSPTQGTAAGRRTRRSKAVSDDSGPYDLTTAPRALTTNPVSGASLLTTSPAVHVPQGLNLLDVMHIRLGHMSEAKIKQAVRDNLYIGCPITYDQIKDLKLQTCYTCQMGRMRAANRNKTLNQNYKPFECLAVDYKGPLEPRTVHQNTGFYLF